MIDALSPRGRQLAGALAKTLELVGEHGKTNQNEALVIALMLIAHVRNTWPQALVALQEGA
jgi:hypothetical protein